MHRKGRNNLQEKQDAYGLFLLDEAQNKKEEDERKNVIRSITFLKDLPGYEDYTFLIDEISMNPVINNTDLNILKQQLGLVAILLPGQDSAFYQNKIRATQKFKSKVAASLSRFSSLRADAKDDRHSFANMKYIYRRDEGKEVNEKDMQNWIAVTKELESKVAFLSRLMYSDITEHSAKIVVQRVLSTLEDRWDVLNDIQRELIIGLKENIDNFNKTFDPDVSDPGWKQRESLLKGEVVSEDKVATEKVKPKNVVDIEEEIPADVLLEQGKQLADEVEKLRNVYQDLVKDIAQQDENIAHNVGIINEFKAQENAWIQLATDVSEQAFSNTNHAPEWAREMPEMPPLAGEVIEKIEPHESYKEAEIKLPQLIGETLKAGSDERVYSSKELEKYKEANESMLAFLKNKINEAKEELESRKKKNAELEDGVTKEREKLNHVIIESKSKIEMGRGLLVKQRQYIINNSHKEIQRVGQNIGHEKADLLLKKARSQFSDLKEGLNKTIQDIYGEKRKQQFISAVDNAMAGDSKALDRLKRKRFFEFRSTQLKRVASLDLLLSAAVVDKSIAEQPNDFHRGMNVVFSTLKEMSSRLQDATLQGDSNFVRIQAIAQVKYKILKKQHASHFSEANYQAETEFRGITKKRDEQVEKIDRQLQCLDQRQRKLDKPLEVKMARITPTFENHSHGESHHADVASASLFAHQALPHAIPPLDRPDQRDEEGERPGGK